MRQRQIAEGNGSAGEGPSPRTRRGVAVAACPHRDQSSGVHRRLAGERLADQPLGLAAPRRRAPGLPEQAVGDVPAEEDPRVAVEHHVAIAERAQPGAQGGPAGMSSRHRPSRPSFGKRRCVRDRYDQAIGWPWMVW